MTKSIQKRLIVFRDQIVSERARQKEIQKQLNVIIQECATAEHQTQNLQQALSLLEQSNITSRDFVKTEVEKLVTQGLQAIFEDPYIKFVINFTTKRNQTEAEFVISYGESEKDQISGDLLATYGGGLIDIVSISLRIIIMQLLKTKGPLILDEPGKNISAQYIGNFGKFLTQISKTFDRQIIMITHNAKLEMFADKTFEVNQINKVSNVTTLTIEEKSIQKALGTLHATTKKRK